MIYPERIVCTPADWAKLQDETKAFLRSLPDAPEGLIYLVIDRCAFAFHKNANQAAGTARANGLPGNYTLNLVNDSATYDPARFTVSYSDADSRVKLSLKLLHL